MEKIDLKNFLLHGVFVAHPYMDEFSASIDLVRSILTSGYIMNRESLKKLLTGEDSQNLYSKAFAEKTSTHYGGDDVVSLGCLDIANFDKYIVNKDGNNNSCIFSSGMYLVIEPTVLNEMHVVTLKTWRGGVPGEIQIVGNIPTSYIRAIYLNNRISGLLDNVTKYLSAKGSIRLSGLDYML